MAAAHECQTRAPEDEAVPGLPRGHRGAARDRTGRPMGKRKTKPTKARADQLMIERGLAATREKARAMILAGELFSGERRIEKAGQLMAEDAELRLAARPRYVGRGGEKLQGALESFALDVEGVTALDVGSSTGGFTDCLLQHGARRVYAVDVGRAQLAEPLRRDARVVVMEGVNARHGIDIPEPVGLVVADVSFISLRLVLPPALAHLKPGGRLLALVKPQFEAGKGKVGRGGVIRDEREHAAVVGGFCLWAIDAARALRLRGIRPSVLRGDAGNQEYFVLLEAVE